MSDREELVLTLLLITFHLSPKKYENIQSFYFSAFINQFIYHRRAGAGEKEKGCQKDRKDRDEKIDEREKND